MVYYPPPEDPDATQPPVPTGPIQYVQVVRQTDAVSVTALVFGIVSALGGWCCFGLPGFVALILGVLGVRETKDGTKAGYGMAVAGIILGVLTGIPWLFLGLFGVVGAFTPTPSSSSP